MRGRTAAFRSQPGAAASLLLFLLCTLAASADDTQKNAWCDSFVLNSDEECTDLAWKGVLKDMFSPDDTCPNSTRYIDVARPTNTTTFLVLEVSASGTDDNCNSTWGRRYNSSTTVDPIISIPKEGFEGPCVRETSFVSKVPPGDPLYADAQAGALNFTLKLGTVNGSKVNMWNGVYNGQGGDIDGSYAPPSDCDNFWL